LIEATVATGAPTVIFNAAVVLGEDAR